ncbi:hypothetical protein, partial [Klebsiella quasipneumoniae]|uniref:hypothetical protein n=1 Tax=Klebsiella quasipneumoniae TaxID=1463165 RepID=UPI001C6FD734
LIEAPDIIHKNLRVCGAQRRDKLGHVFCSKKGFRPNEGLSERAEIFTISNFKGLQHADWLCTGLYRGSKPRFTEKRADPRRM